MKACKMKALKWFVGGVLAILSVVAQAETTDIDELNQRVLDACPLQWEDIKADIDPSVITGDVWQGDTVDRDTFIQFLQATLGEDAPDTTGLNAMADDPSTVAAECATQRIGFLDGLVSKLPADVLTTLAAVSEQLQYIGAGRLPSDCNVGEIAGYDGEKWRCAIAIGGIVLVPEEGEGWLDCQNALSGGQTGDGVYTIDPDGEGGAEPFPVFCDMSTDGGGWIKVSVNDLTGDNLWAAARDGNMAELTKCQGTSGTLTYYPYIDPSSFGDQHVDFGFVPNENAVFDLTYTNPATGGDFTNVQLDSIRARITTFSTSSRMVSVTCDNDNKNPSHEAYLYNDFGGAGTEYITTPGTGGDDDIIWWIHHPNNSESFVVSGSPDPGSLPVSLILPKSLAIGHFYPDSAGGGVAWGYEQGYVLVK